MTSASPSSDAQAHLSVSPTFNRDITDSLIVNTTFVVVDLETTGLSAQEDRIIEIGAVRIHGGEEISRFSTFVDPGRLIPPLITNITGISDDDVDGAPEEAQAVKDFLQFSRGTVLVAHNARFDIGFLQAAAMRAHVTWPQPTHLCTLVLARTMLDRSSVGSFKLSSLARHFHATTTPTHRALDDALATVTVFHGLLEELGSRDIIHVGDIPTRSSRGATGAGVSQASTQDASSISPSPNRYRHLINNVPPSPGVYIFRSHSGEPLYIGTAVNLRRRLRQYINGSDKRRLIPHLLPQTRNIDTIECAHGFEAEVREATLIAKFRPPFNRRSKEPRQYWWISGARPRAHDTSRATISRDPRSPNALGPFRTRQKATTAARLLGIGAPTASGLPVDQAIHWPPSLSTAEERIAAFLNPDWRLDSTGAATLSQTDLSDNITTEGHSYSLQALEEHSESQRDQLDYYQQLINVVTDLASEGRFQRAALTRDAVAALLSTTATAQAYRALAATPEMRLTAPDGEGGWNLAVVRYGRLASAGHVARGGAHGSAVDLLLAHATHVEPDSSPLGGASIEQLRVIRRWMEKPGVRPGPGCEGWFMPVQGAGRFTAWIDKAQKATES
ncbi:DEDD exonuclease domain-containing protein [uncultured Corynebacterium sp.]|uniref:DEDD exonuclease domain-containing protein n=1 Tax=uncultured Corynebacterium sp. TaxID=159447 RepID=UPI0025DF93E8|nr:DEDD exonuclease domain-containing protein [uncultured Corynebacterium sp.]